MTVKINYIKKKTNQVSTNIILFVNEKFDIKNLKKYISSSEFSYIYDLLKRHY